MPNHRGRRVHGQVPTSRRHPLTWAVQRVKDGCIQQALATRAAPQFAQDVCGQAGAWAQMYSGRAWADTLAAQAEQSRETLGACSPLKPGQHRMRPAPAARGQRRQGTRRAGAHAGLSGRASERRRRSRRWAIAAVPCRPGAACALATCRCRRAGRHRRQPRQSRQHRLLCLDRQVQQERVRRAGAAGQRGHFQVLPLLRQGAGPVPAQQLPGHRRCWARPRSPLLMAALPRLAAGRPLALQRGQPLLPAAAPAALPPADAAWLPCAAASWTGEPSLPVAAAAAVAAPAQAAAPAPQVAQAAVILAALPGATVVATGALLAAALAAALPLLFCVPLPRLRQPVPSALPAPRLGKTLQRRWRLLAALLGLPGQQHCWQPCPLP